MPIKYKAHGKGEFSGQRFPFGCKVWFLPSETKSKTSKAAKEKRQPKWGGRASIGVFVGYVTSPGCAWTGRYLVWDLADFLDINFSAEASGRVNAMASPHQTAKILLCGKEVNFPCKPPDGGKGFFLRLRRMIISLATL